MSVDVSVVLPCHNGARRLAETLRHVAAQDVPPGLSWEVVVVDNASTDGTAAAAGAAWPPAAPTPLRVVREPRLGLSFAHQCGFAEARGEVVAWVEDDNWIAPDWLRVSAAVMRDHPEAGAWGGFNEAACEAPPPAWFESFRSAYAVGAQGEEPGDITETRGYLWGAGLTVRRAAWEHLTRHGFRPLLVDRQGSASVNSGGDAEICFALRLAGWRLRYEPRMRLRHRLAAHRLDWWYLRRLYRGFGASTVGFDPYTRALAARAITGRHIWAAEVRRALVELKSCARKTWASRRHAFEGDPEVLTLELKLGRLAELLQQRGAYDRNLRAIALAPWRRAP